MNCPGGTSRGGKCWGIGLCLDAVPEWCKRNLVTLLPNHCHNDLSLLNVRIGWFLVQQMVQFFDYNSVHCVLNTRLEDDDVVTEEMRL